MCGWWAFFLALLHSHLRLPLKLVKERYGRHEYSERQRRADGANLGERHTPAPRIPVVQGATAQGPDDASEETNAVARRLSRALLVLGLVLGPLHHDGVGAHVAHDNARVADEEEDGELDDGRVADVGEDGHGERVEDVAEEEVGLATVAKESVGVGEETVAELEGPGDGHEYRYSVLGVVCGVGGLGLKDEKKEKKRRKGGAFM